jgi:GT2 family glycosyltransferase
MSLRREAFEKAGTFLSSLGYHQPMAEDLEFSLRVKKRTGKKLLFNPRAKVYHKVYAYRISPKFVAARAHHIGVSRRILRTSGIKEQAHFRLEKGVIGSILKILLRTPIDILKNPVVAWKKFIISVIIVIFAAIGFVFPGKNMRVSKEIRHGFE